MVPPQPIRFKTKTNWHWAHTSGRVWRWSLVFLRVLLALLCCFRLLWLVIVIVLVLVLLYWGDSAIGQLWALFPLAEVVRLRKFRLKCGWLIWCFRLNFLSEFLGQFLEFISSVFHFISLRFEWESSYFGLALSLSLTIAIVKLLIRT